MKFNKFIVLLIIFVFFPLSIVRATSDNTTSLNIYSNSAILIDSASGKILYEKDAEKQLFPASTTKILTAIITLENCDLSSVVTVSRASVLSVPSRIFFCISIRRRASNCWRFTKIATYIFSK